MTVHGEAITITKISKLVTLKFFPIYEIRHKIYGSKESIRDVLVSFDLFSKMFKDKVQLESYGFRW